MENNTQTRKFGLLTTIAMIIGIVIGSGIFFKTPQIIQATNGNILQGALAFILAAFSIVFGGLTIAQYSKIDDKVGGIVSYCEAAFGKTVGYLAGWFQVVIYYPAIVSVVTWVGANYTLALFGIDNLLTDGVFNPYVWPLTFIYLVFFYLLNTLQTKRAGFFQSLSMFVKIVALILFGICGFLFGNPSSIIHTASIPSSNGNLMIALVAVAFAFDGWMIAPSIAHEIKNPKKNLTIALVIAPLIITGIYLLYYFGLAVYAPSDVVLSGIDPIGILANNLFGNVGMKIVYLCVVISILGTVNGIILGYIRLPYALALRDEVPFSSHLSKINTKYDIPVNSSITSFVLSLVYLLLHFASLDGAAVYNFTFFSGLEVDNLPIIANYFFLIIMYIAVLGNRIKSNSFVKGKIYPTLAIIGALIVLYAGFTKPQFNVYLVISVIIILSGLLIRPKKSV